MKITTFTDIPRLQQPASYRVNSSWLYTFEWIEECKKKENIAQLDIDPDFQRAHVWTKKQQVAYVEFVLRGGNACSASNNLLFNCVGWMRTYEGPFVLVDGKQRLEAVRKFLQNENRAFGSYYDEYTDRLPSHCEFIISVNNLPTQADVLQWYLELNSSGVSHTKDELDKVREMIKQKGGVKKGSSF